MVPLLLASVGSVLGGVDRWLGEGQRKERQAAAETALRVKVRGYLRGDAGALDDIEAEEDILTAGRMAAIADQEQARPAALRAASQREVGAWSWRTVLLLMVAIPVGIPGAIAAVVHVGSTLEKQGRPAGVDQAVPVVQTSTPTPRRRRESRKADTERTPIELPAGATQL